MVLRRWWTHKYRLPWNHNLYQESTISELLIEFYEDKFSEDRLEAFKDENGEYFLGDTGDAQIDKWEEEIRLGIDPDLTEGMSAESLAKLAKEKEKYKRARELSKEINSINDDYTLVDPSKVDPRYASKYGSYDSKHIVPKILGDK